MTLPTQRYTVSYEWTRWREPWDPDDANSDVYVTLEDGTEFVATFFTLRNVAALMSNWRRSGEHAGGSYFCAHRAILVARLDDQTVRKTIDDLFACAAFHDAFERIVERPADRSR